MVVYIRRKELNWIGHTIQKGENNLARRALDWNPQGFRRAGRPTETWSRSVRREAENSEKLGQMLRAWPEITLDGGSSLMPYALVWSCSVNIANIYYIILKRIYCN